MTILFAGGEDITFTFLGGTGALITTASWDANFARCAVRVGNGTSTSDPPANRVQTPTFTSVSTVWIHGEMMVGISSGNNNTTANEQAVLVRSPDGLVRVLLRQTGTAGQLKVCTRNAAGTITDLATATGTITQGLHKFDWQIIFDTSTALYIDGVSILTYTGDLRTNAATQLNQVDLMSVNNSGQVSNETAWSEVIIADEDTRGMRLWTLPPQAAGNTQSWTPNTVGNINEISLNEGTVVSASSNNSLSQWTTPTTLPSGTWTVKAIVQEARAEVGATGPQHFDWSVRTASTDFTGGASNAPSVGSFTNFSNFIWATNPNTSAAWATTDIASGFNLGLKSLA